MKHSDSSNWYSVKLSNHWMTRPQIEHYSCFFYKDSTELNSYPKCLWFVGQVWACPSRSCQFSISAYLGILGAHRDFRIGNCYSKMCFPPDWKIVRFLIWIDCFQLSNSISSYFDLSIFQSKLWLEHLWAWTAAGPDISPDLPWQFWFCCRISLYGVCDFCSFFFLISQSCGRSLHTRSFQVRYIFHGLHLAWIIST